MRGSRYLNLHEKSERDTPNTSPPHRNTLSSTPGKRTCGSTGRDCEGLTPDSSTGGDKKNSWNGQEAEAENKEEDQESYNRDGDKKTTPSLGSTKLRRPSAVEGQRTGSSNGHVPGEHAAKNDRYSAASPRSSAFENEGRYVSSTCRRNVDSRQRSRSQWVTTVQRIAIPKMLSGVPTT